MTEWTVNKGAGLLYNMNETHIQTHKHDDDHKHAQSPVTLHAGVKRTDVCVRVSVFVCCPTSKTINNVTNLT